ncbi:MAG: phosphotransferase, partial [Deltaproteobacteria bacterium]|nr:phosphotransferase [Deltaproteobacteria bacterium]
MGQAATALAAWGIEAELDVIGDGLINRTWLARTARGAVGFLQELNTRIFRAEVHEDIEAVTDRLAAAGLPTPRLVRTVHDRLWFTDPDGAVWRLLTPVGDRTVHRLVDPADARSAGGLVARFHAATRDLDWTFRSVRPGAHHTPTHMERMRVAVEAHPDHRLAAAVAPLADGIAAAWGRWEGPSELPVRIVHGDLKISNVRFLGAEAHALVDLDTLAHGTLDVELGDMLRSWCNRASEDEPEPAFDLALFAGAIAGYAGWAQDVTAAEWTAIVPGAERIALELAARFAADALAESYFGWNPRFGTRGEHNLLRARGQLAL